jgi:hypothetical protein
MSPNRLQRAVARATGESLREIRRRGFGPVDSPEGDFDPEPDDLPPQIVDWDALALERPALFPAI